MLCFLSLSLYIHIFIYTISVTHCTLPANLAKTAALKDVFGKIYGNSNRKMASWSSNARGNVLVVKAPEWDSGDLGPFLSIAEDFYMTWARHLAL